MNLQRLLLTADDNQRVYSAQNINYGYQEMFIADVFCQGKELSW